MIRPSKSIHVFLFFCATLLSAQATTRLDEPLAEPFRIPLTTERWGQTSLKGSFGGALSNGFSVSQFIVPGSLMATGAVIRGTPWLHEHIDNGLRDWVQSYEPKRVYYDDYAQYALLTSVFLLKGLGVESRHDWESLITLTSGTCLLGYVSSTIMKHMLAVSRPGRPNEHTSFPSGHTITSFLGAEILRREYGEEYPAIAIVGYLFATGIACMRIYNDRHFLSDILAGAGFAMFCVGVTYALTPDKR